jgi:hypothetical protein
VVCSKKDYAEELWIYFEAEVVGMTLVLSVAEDLSSQDTSRRRLKATGIRVLARMRRVIIGKWARMSGVRATLCGWISGRNQGRLMVHMKYMALQCLS